MSEKKPTYEELERQVVELRDRERQLSSAQKIAKLGFWDLNLVTGSLYWSDETYIHFGFNPQEFEPTYERFRSVVHPDDIDYVQMNVDAALKDDKEYNIVFRVIRDSGEIRHIATSGEAYRDDDGTAIRFIGTQSDITDRKEAEDSLIKTQAMLRETEKLAKIGGWELYINTLETTWTEAVYEIHEVDMSHKTNFSNGISFYTPKSRPIIENAVQNAIKYGDTFDEELEIVTAKGNARFVHAFGKADLEKGKVFGTFQDITERKKAEELFKKERQRKEQYFNISQVGFAVLGNDENLETINEKGSSILGYYAQEIEGKNWFDILVPENVREEVRGVFQQLMMGDIEPVEYYENALLNKSGEERTMSFHNTVIRDANDKITGILFSFEDITERKKAEYEIEKSHSLLSNLACLVPGVIYQYRLYPDGSSAFPYSSPGMNDIYEVTPEEVRDDATPVFGRLHPDDYDHVSDCIQESARTLQMFYCEFRVILPRQGLRWRWSQAHPEQMADGSILWHGIISDITERKKLEEIQHRLQEQENHAVVGKVAGKMAHDFNNVLGIIMGTSQLMQSNDIPQEMKADIDIILESAKKGRDLTKNLLFFAKDQEPKLSQFDHREKIDIVITSLKSELKDIEVNLSYGSSTDKLLADAGLLENALINMLQNSIHALSPYFSPTNEKGRLCM